MNDRRSIGSQLDSECNKLTYCQATGCMQVSKFNGADKKLIPWRSSVRLNETDIICYCHEKIF